MCLCANKMLSKLANSTFIIDIYIQYSLVTVFAIDHFKNILGKVEAKYHSNLDYPTYVHQQ